LLAVCAIGALSACRDGRFVDGSRISDRHVISARPASRGGSTLTAAELRSGSFVSFNGDLASLQSGLRTGIGGQLAITRITGTGLNDIRGAFTPAWLAPGGTVTVFDPTRREGIGAPRGVLEERRVGSLDPLSFQNMRLEYIALCTDPLTSDFFPPDDDGNCDRLNLDQETEFAGLNLSDFLESISFSVRSRDVTVRWVRPSAFLNQRVTRETTAILNGNFCTPSDTTCGFGYECPPGVTRMTQCRPRSCTTNADCVTDPQGLTWPSASCERRGTRRQCAEVIDVRYDSDADPVNTPVLEVELPLDVETDLTDLSANLLATIVIDRFVVRYRFQPTVCDPVNGCSPTREPRLDTETGNVVPRPTHLGYRGDSPDGDLAASRANVQVNAVAVGDASARVFPGLGLGLVCLFPFTTALCLDIIIDAQRGVEDGLAKVGRGTSDLADQLVSGRALSRGPRPPNLPVATLQFLCFVGGGGACPLSAAALQSINARASFNLGDALVAAPKLATDGSSIRGRFEEFPLGGPQGEFTNRTIVALGARRGTLGASIVGITINTAPYASWCLGGGVCRADITPEDCRVCTECADPAAASHPFCRFSTPTIIRVPPGAQTLPDAPTLARVMDALGNVGSEVRAVFTRPLDDARAVDGADRIYSRIEVCPSEAVPETECRDRTGPVAAKFTFVTDSDGDGLVDALDNCPGVRNQSQVDGDGDGIGDACDNCPCTVSPDQRNVDGDEFGDVCDDDIDNDGCFNAYRLPATACAVPDARPNPPGAVVEDQRLSDTELGPDGEPKQTDGDGLIDDCDPDDDEDGILDDGNGDGLGVYTPCRGSGTIGLCDDNCEDTVNADQLDSNSNGLGNECDACTGAFCDRGTTFLRPPVSYGPGSFITPQCLADGPDCWGFAVGQCLSLTGACGGYSDFYDLFDAGGARLARLSPAIGQGSATAAIPDLDGDGRQELVVGAPGENARSGRVVAVSSRGNVLFELAGARAGDQFGAALAVAGNVLFVGAPGARDTTGALTGKVARYMIGGVPYLDGAFYGQRPGDEFGASLAVVGDGEAIVGVIVGAPGARIGHAVSAGRLEARSLRGARLGDFTVGVPGARLGAAAAAVLPNAFKDAPGGILAAMPTAAGGRGIVAFFRWTGTVEWQVEGNVGERLGASLAFAADFDADGRAEIAVGAPGAADGRGRVYMADARGFLQTFSEGGEGDQLGVSVAATGDLDRDGTFDLTVGLGGRVLTPGRTDGSWALLPGVGGKDPNTPELPGEPR